jgi:hypothetical protein
MCQVANPDRRCHNTEPYHEGKALGIYMRSIFPSRIPRGGVSDTLNQYAIENWLRAEPAAKQT